MEKIPDNIYNSIEEDSIYHELVTGSKKIFWIGPDCSQGRAAQNEIDTFLENNSLNEYYIHKPVLVTQLMATTPAERFFIENCGEHFCIILPEMKKIVKAPDEQKLFSALQKYKTW